MALESESFSRQWKEEAVKTVFSGMKKKLAKLTAKEIETVSNALSVYALSRQSALDSPITTGLYKEALLGHRNIQDELNSALSIIDLNSIDTSDIPFIFIKPSNQGETMRLDF